MSLVDYAIAARRRRVNWRTLRVQPGLLLAWTVTIVAALMAIDPCSLSWRLACEHKKTRALARVL